MPSNVIFLYDVEFVPFKNPPGTKERFEENLKEQAFRANGLDFLMSGLGGMVHTRGIVFRRTEALTMQDRQKVEDWLRTRPMRCTVRLSDLEQESDSTDYFRAITERVFEVDNLTEEDRRQAAAYEAQIKSRVFQQR